MFNIMDIIVLAVIVIAGFIGYKNGCVKTVIRLLSFFVAIGLALLFYKPLAVILTENTSIDDWIIEKIVSTEVTENEKQEISEGNIDDDLNDVEATTNETEKNEVEENNDLLYNILGHLPDIFSENFNFNEATENAKHELATQVSELIMNLLSLIIIYVIVKVALFVAMFIIDGIMKIPVLKQLNEVLGLIVGAIVGVMQLYVAFSVITFISSITDISFVVDSIKASMIARVLFENNLIINLLF